ncbi:MAG TPA: DUF2400 family protein [Candidatus Bathyarchaeia archaeon]
MVATGEAVDLLLKFVNTNSNIVDTQWDRRMSPRLLFNPYSEFVEDKKVTAHYFLLVASILEDRVVGYSENARRLLILLHKKFANRLFEIRKPHLFQEEIAKSEFYSELGPRKETIPETLTLVNLFIREKAEKDLIQYSRKFRRPIEFVENLAQNFEALSGLQKDKAWTYMRWMVRPKPDLQILNHFSPADLLLPLTKETANVATSLGLLNTTGPYMWKDANTLSYARERVTRFAKRMFPNDPAKVDYPFFLLGRWLKQKSLNRSTLTEALKFSDHLHELTGQPHSYYHSLSRYKSGWEMKTARTLSRIGIPYGYESVSFPLPGDVYTPDFILDKSVNGRKIILEPHYEMTTRQIRKYAQFKRTYGHQFMLILLLKNDLISYYNKHKLLSDNVCDDVWPIEFVDLLAEKIRTGNYEREQNDGAGFPTESNH